MFQHFHEIFHYLFELNKTSFTDKSVIIQRKFPPIFKASILKTTWICLVIPLLIPFSPSKWAPLTAAVFNNYSALHFNLNYRFVVVNIACIICCCLQLPFCSYVLLYLDCFIRNNLVFIGPLDQKCLSFHFEVGGNFCRLWINQCFIKFRLK